jgi:hypothetical protein
MRRQSMLEAKKLQLETEGVTVRDSEFSCGLRFFRDTGLEYEQAAKELLQKTGDLHRKTTTKYF